MPGFALPVLFYGRSSPISPRMCTSLEDAYGVLQFQVTRGSATRVIIQLVNGVLFFCCLAVEPMRDSPPSCSARALLWQDDLVIRLSGFYAEAL